MGKKNITLALDDEIYEHLDDFKKELHIKSFSQLIVLLTHFYIDNKEKVHELQNSQSSPFEDLDTIRTELALLRENIVTQKELSYLETNITLIKQNYDIVQSLMSRLDEIQDNLVNKSTHEKLDTRVERLEGIVEKLLVVDIESGKLAIQENREIKALLKAKENMKNSG